MDRSNSFNADFCIRIDFQKDSENPSRVFKAAYELIDALQEIDRTLVGVIDQKIEPVLLLEDVETGSLKIWLRQALEEVDDEALKNLDWKPQVGKYLIQAKYFLIAFCKDETTVTNGSQLAPLEQDIFQLAEKTNANKLPHYRPVNRKGLLEGMTKISTALGNLTSGDTAQYITKDKTAPFNLSFKIAPTIEDILTAEETKLSGETILKVKKAVFEGDAQWEFKYENKLVKAKILDTAWLNAYQRGFVMLLPGDAIKVQMEQWTRFDDKGDVVSEQYTILKVIKVVRNNDGSQQQVMSHEY